MTMTIDGIKHRIAPVLRRHGVKRAVLFGSWARGNATGRSDVDLMVDSGLQGLAFVGLMGELREALDGRDVDVLDVSHIERDSRVDAEIRGTGILIYEA